MEAEPEGLVRVVVDRGEGMSKVANTEGVFALQVMSSPCVASFLLSLCNLFHINVHVHPTEKCPTAPKVGCLANFSFLEKEFSNIMCGA